MSGFTLNDAPYIGGIDEDEPNRGHLELLVVLGPRYSDALVAFASTNQLRFGVEGRSVLIRCLSSFIH